MLSVCYLRYYAFTTHAKYLITHYTWFPAFLFSKDIIFSPSRLYYFLHTSYCTITRILHLFGFIESSFANNLVMTVLFSFCAYYILAFPFSHHLSLLHLSIVISSLCQQTLHTLKHLLPHSDSFKSYSSSSGWYRDCEQYEFKYSKVSSLADHVSE